MATKAKQNKAASHKGEGSPVHTRGPATLKDILGGARRTVARIVHNGEVRLASEGGMNSVAVEQRF